MPANLENSAVPTGLEKAVFIPISKKCKKAKWLSEEALQISEKRGEKQGRKGKIYPTEFQRIFKER